MSFIDLHVHTTASDGTYTPKEVVEEAVRRNLSVIAITDHDTTMGVFEAMDVMENTISDECLIIVPGVEISCEYNHREIHILGLFIDYKNESLEKNLTSMREVRDNRNDKMVALFQEHGIPMTIEELKFGEPDTVITRAHFARYLVEHGYVKTKDDAFKKYIGDGCPFYLPRKYIEPKTAIEWIHQAGGLAFLAHPYLYGLKEAQIREMLLNLKELGLDGVEAYHSTTDNGRTNQLREYAKQMELLVSGGSDFHGDNKPYIYMGVGKGNLRITHHVYDKIVNREV